jgi:pimeloyl-ACP methyl ester carboxylesterase
MTVDHSSYDTTPNAYVAVGGSRYAYRSLGANDDAPPLVLLQHFTGTMDDWDPKVIEGLARRRRLILFDNAGIGASAGKTPDSVKGMAHDAEAFCDALKLQQIDVLGFSLGGFVAQQILFDHPDRIRKVVLAGTGPQGGVGIKDLPAVIQWAVKKGSEHQVHPKAPLFFTESQTGKAAAAAFLARIGKHAVDAEPAASSEAIEAQQTAIVTWGSAPADGAKLEGIRQPVLVVNGSNDVMVPTANSIALYQQVPTAQLVLYPDSGHGSLFQYYEQFVASVDTFLRTPWEASLSRGGYSA